MTREQARQSVETGIEIALDMAERADIVGTGDMGIGNTTPSAAIACALTGLAPDAIAGRGTGLNEEQRKKKAAEENSKPMSDKVYKEIFGNDSRGQNTPPQS